MSSKYKVTAKKKLGNHYVNDWFKDQNLHLSYYTDSLSEAKRIITERKKKNNYYSEDCVPQIILTNNGKEVPY